ncbi:uncharacterized protein LOC135467485 [Liolophura sinensis]|uniref:uncharacterized protein LOC135467485 n=1 Tax=Liolophura sinensis TaxID=3198878 RepID=UPI003158E465
MMATEVLPLATFILILYQFSPGEAIQCYQCDSNEDLSCPSNMPFDINVNAVVDCNSFEAHVPGQFCAKIYQEGPGWGSWIKYTRRCASWSDTGVAWGCRWMWDDNGVFRETCYCDRDGCNSSVCLSLSIHLLTVTACVVTAIQWFL